MQGEVEVAAVAGAVWVSWVGSCRVVMGIGMSHMLVTML
jgi:hypothetical protein